MSFDETTEQQRQWSSDQEAPSRYGPEFSLEINTLDTYLENNIAAESILPSADQGWLQDAMAF